MRKKVRIRWKYKKTFWKITWKNKKFIKTNPWAQGFVLVLKYYLFFIYTFKYS